MAGIYARLEKRDAFDGIERVVVGAVIKDSGKILLLRRRTGEFMAGLWELPSGKVEKVEALPDALYREVFEETGLTVSEIAGYLGAFDYISGSGKRTRQHTFVVRVEQVEPIKLAEHDQFQWAESKSSLPVSDEVSSLLTMVCSSPKAT
ncbi:MAG: NUDIX domain-containing protein [Corynebacteriales bacterium]|nr:NUDIX domain-containing protein [Mycobacteriales bacterium]